MGDVSYLSHPCILIIDRRKNLLQEVKNVGNRYSFKQSFGDWCLENERQDILDLWDYDKNVVSPFEIPSGTKNRYYFKCCNGLHDSESKRILSITDKPDHKVICKQCEAEGLYRQDLFGCVFGDLTVIKHDDERTENDSHRMDYWICQCSCGEILSTDAYKLISGRKHICGRAGKHKSKIETPDAVAALRKTPEYYQYRKAVIIKDNAKCIITGERPKNIEVHHLYPFSDYPSERFNPSCGVCVSKEYHSVGINGSFHDLYGVHNNTPDQFQDYVNMKRRELGIMEYFDVYEYMNDIYSDTLPIDDTMLDL